MTNRSYRRRFALAASLTAVFLLAALSLGVAPANAQTLPSPPAGPRWFIGKVDTDRGSGSDTTFFLMQKISDLYNQAALYGCTLSATDNATCDLTQDQSTTDLVDNYDR